MLKRDDKVPDLLGSENAEPICIALADRRSNRQRNRRDAVSRSLGLPHTSRALTVAKGRMKGSSATASGFCCHRTTGGEGQLYGSI